MPTPQAPAGSSALESPGLAPVDPAGQEGMGRMGGKELLLDVVVDLISERRDTLFQGVEKAKLSFIHPFI